MRTRSGLREETFDGAVLNCLVAFCIFFYLSAKRFLPFRSAIWANLTMRDYSMPTSLSAPEAAIKVAEILAGPYGRTVRL